MRSDPPFTADADHRVTAGVSRGRSGAYAFEPRLTLLSALRDLAPGKDFAAEPSVPSELVSNAPFAYENYLDFEPGNEIKTQGTSFQLDYDFDAFTLTSITAFRTLDQYMFGDVDYTSARLVTPEGGNVSDTQIDTFTQEFRLTSASDGALQWMVGAFYFTEEVEIDGRFGYGPDFRPYGDILSGGGISFVESFLGFPEGSFLATNQGFPSEKYTMDDDTLSLFGQIDWEIITDLTLTLGLNYTESQKEATANLVSTDIFAALPLGGPPAEPLQALQFLPPFLNYPNEVEDGKTDDDATTYTFRLSYNINDFVSIYGGYSTGFKASSWNLSRDSRPFEEDIPALVEAGLDTPNLRAGTRQ